MKEMMNTTVKRKIIGLILVSILTSSLSGCIAGNPFIVTEQDKQQEKEEVLQEEYATAEKGNVQIDFLQPLKFSTTGSIMVNDRENNFVDPTKNPGFNETGVSIETIKSKTDNHVIESIVITYAITEQYDTPIISTMPDEKYLIAAQSTGTGSDISFYVEANNTVIEEELADSLNKAIKNKTKQVGEFATSQDSVPDYMIYVSSVDGSMIVQGPSIEGVTDPNSQNALTEIPEVDTKTGKTKVLYYSYTDAAGENKVIEISPAEQPYYDVEKQEIAINWVISEPVTLN
jgi:hypothetical protein